MSSTRRSRDVASNVLLSDDVTGFGPRNRPDCPPVGSRDSEKRRPEDTPSQVSADLDPSLIAARKDKVFADDGTPNRPA